MNDQAAREEVLALMQALEEEPHHVQHVAMLAVHLFDELEDLHGLRDVDRLLLEAASLLHDVGWSTAPSGRGHHRESARIIREHRWQNFSSGAVNLMALVARYHRKSLPQLEHEDFAALAPAERMRVQLLAAHLRVADGLDRGHQQHITHLSAEITAGEIIIHLASQRPVTREIAAATRKSDLAAAVFQRRVHFALPPGAGSACATERTPGTEFDGSSTFLSIRPMEMGMNEDARLEECLALMRQLEVRPIHVQHVAHLATLLFDGLAGLHRLGPPERLLLHGAGLLHDIGHQYDFNGIGHHKESARLIREHPWQHFSRPEVEIMAQVARYHRKALPDFKHEEFRILSDVARQTVQALGGLLRLADSLDRSHEQRVSSLRVEVRSNQIIVHLEATEPIDPEIKAARIKSDLATLVWQRDFLFYKDGQEIQLRSRGPEEPEPSP